MKCDKYKELIDRLLEGEISASESEEIQVHTDRCEICKKEYSTALSYKTITNNLKASKPVLDGKSEFIEKILDGLPDKVGAIDSLKIKNHWFTDSKFRRVIATAAAAMVLFFIVQQTHDAWQIKQLEVKMAQKQHVIDYNNLREQSILSVLTQLDRDDKPGSLLSKYKTLFIKKSFIKFSQRNNYLQLHLRKTLLK